MTAATIPTIDLADFHHADPNQRSAFVRTLGEGLEHFGFLTVEGHGVDHAVIRRVYEAFETFFALPDATKRRYAGVEGGARGYTPFGVEHAKGSDVPDLKEFWHVGQEPPADHPLRAVYPPNVWPAEVPSLHDDVRAFYRALETCAATLLEGIAMYYDLPQDTFASMMQHGNSILRAIHYPPVPDDRPMGAVRAAAHEDINLITLLCEATEPGLEILTHDGSWLPVTALDGQIVVDAGDMLSRVTNGVVPATTHRVVNPPGAARDRHRYSMPFFVHPYPDCDLTVLPRFVSDDRPAQFPPITAGAFLQQRLREIGLIKS
ncbi:MAG: 2-oxoglutarate and iron-dependent oxygenase domain-containing protein [Acidobacteriota bacterium]